MDKNEIASIERVVNDAIGWATNKDVDLLYSVIAQDENLHIINPDNSELKGFTAFAEFANEFWLDPRFKATHFEVKNLEIILSGSGNVAWYYCRLDDLIEWDGKPSGWHDVRWTGIVEKRNGKWVHTQMHFSFPKE